MEQKAVEREEAKRQRKLLSVKSMEDVHSGVNVISTGKVLDENDIYRANESLEGKKSEQDHISLDDLSGCKLPPSEQI